LKNAVMLSPAGEADGATKQNDASCPIEGLIALLFVLYIS